MDIWQGRIDREEGEGGRRWHQVIKAYDGTQKMALVGFACDAGVARNQGRIGAAEGPDALRRMMANLPVIHEVPADAGNIVCMGDALEAAQAAYADQVAAMIRGGTCRLVSAVGMKSLLPPVWGCIRRCPARASASSILTRIWMCVLTRGLPQARRSASLRILFLIAMPAWVQAASPIRLRFLRAPGKWVHG